MKVLDLENLSIEDTKRLNSFVPQVKKTVNDICDKLLLEKGCHTSFLFSPIMARNPLLHKFYVQLLFLQFILSAYSEYDNFLTNDYLLYYCAHSNGLKKVQLKEKNLSILRYRITPFKHVLQSIYNIMLNIRLAKMLPTIHLPKDLSLIDCFFLPKDVENTNFINSYFSGIEKELDDSVNMGMHYLVSFAGFPFSIKAFLKKRKTIHFKSIYPLICKEKYLNILDYLQMIFFFKKYKFESVKIADLEISSLLNSSNAYRFHPQCVESYLNWIFIKKFTKKKKLVYFYTWFENQILGKAYLHSIHVHSPKTLTYGYQGLIYSDKLFLSFQPLTAEYKLKLLPQNVLIIGNSCRKRLCEFAPDIISTIAKTFRYSYLANPVLKKKQLGLITVTLPYYENEAIYLIKFVSRLARTNEKLIFLFKMHPASNVEKISSEIIMQNQINMKTSNINTQELINESITLISSASGTCFEAVCTGTPALVVGIPNKILQNTIPEEIDPDLWRECWTTDEANDFIGKFNFFSNNDWNVFKEKSENIKKLYFYFG